jgi:hypothetical protein
MWLIALRGLRSPRGCPDLVRGLEARLRPGLEATDKGGGLPEGSLVEALTVLGLA